MIKGIRSRGYGQGGYGQWSAAYLPGGCCGQGLWSGLTGQGLWSWLSGQGIWSRVCSLSPPGAPRGSDAAVKGHGQGPWSRVSDQGVKRQTRPPGEAPRGIQGLGEVICCQRSLVKGLQSHPGLGEVRCGQGSLVNGYGQWSAAADPPMGAGGRYAAVRSLWLGVLCVLGSPVNVCSGQGLWSMFLING